MTWDERSGRMSVVELTALHERLHAVIGGLTYRSLGERTKQHPETVRRYMQGQSPSVEFLSAVCRCYDVNAEWLLTGRGPIKQSQTRAHALREANASELLSAIAASLERLSDRVDRIELFVQTQEARLRGSASKNPDGRGGQGDIRESKQGTEKGDTGSDPASRAGRIADAVPDRPRPDAG